MKKQNRHETIKKTIEEFNKYRSPEANAGLVSLKANSLKIEFTGHFCKTCGFYDYFDDFLIFLEEFGPKAKIEKVKEIGEGAVVIFKIV